MLIPIMPPCSRSDGVTLSAVLFGSMSALIRCTWGMKAVPVIVWPSRVYVTVTLRLTRVLSVSRRVGELGTGVLSSLVITSPGWSPSWAAGLFGSVAGSQAFGAFVVGSYW